MAFAQQAIAVPPYGGASPVGGHSMGTGVGKTPLSFMGNSSRVSLIPPEETPDSSVSPYAPE